MAQYLKSDTQLGYIEDTAEIENEKFNNLRHTILGCMLGDFDETGAYVVSPEIVDELLEMEKYVVDTYDNIEICKSVLKLDKQITFMVTYEGNKATLSLIEKLSYEANFRIDSGTYSNINEYVLDSVETTGEVDRNVLYRRWNIGDFGGNVVDIFSCDDSILEKYFGIVNRFKFLLETNKILLDKEEEIEEIEAEYTNTIIELLKRFPKLNDAVFKTIKETLTENKDSINSKKPNFVKTFNEVLENAISKNIKELNEKELEDFNVEKRNAIRDLNVKRSAVIESEQIKNENSQSLEDSPKIIRFKIVDHYQSKSVSSLGELFVSAYKKVVQTKNNPEKQSEVKSEKAKLLTALVGAGLGAMVVGPVGAVAGATTGAVVADTVEEIKADVKKTEVGKLVAKKAEAKKPAAKKPAAKKPAAKKPAAKKPAAKKPAAKKPEKSKKKDDEKEKKQEYVKRLILMTAHRHNTEVVQPSGVKRVKRTSIVDVNLEKAEKVDLEGAQKVQRNVKTSLAPSEQAVEQADVGLDLNSI